MSAGQIACKPAEVVVEARIRRAAGVGGPWYAYAVLLPHLAYTEDLLAPPALTDELVVAEDDRAWGDPASAVAVAHRLAEGVARPLGYSVRVERA